MEKKIKMMAAASVALHYMMGHSNATDEEVLQYVADFIMQENVRDDDIKFGMIAAATETYKLYRENSKMTEKEYLRKVMENIPKILDNSYTTE